MGAPSLSDVTRSTAILEHWKDNWLEAVWLGCSVDRWLENKTWEDVLAWVDERVAVQQRLWLLHPLLPRHRTGQIRPGVGNYISTGTYFDPALYQRPTIEGRNAALIGGAASSPTVSTTSSTRPRCARTLLFYQGNRPLHPFEGETIPVDPEKGKTQNKYSWAKSPRYEVGDSGTIPLEAGPLSRRMAAAGPGRPSIRTTTRSSSTSITRSGPASWSASWPGCTRRRSTTSG